ncbi:MAG: tetraacyldisaccharide 4'-kinase [Wenzhouxiangellaceae bacterium]|nr:tetraacyldisaccharide 4'-kinase [Wenzhouxiangellaceae bacterium]
MRRRLAQRLERIWYGSQPAPPWLAAAEAIYRAFAGRRIARPHKPPPCPVVVVGNLVAGGSGKTPVVAALAEYLTRAGLAVAIVSRGYGGREPLWPMRVTAASTASAVGDEALELFGKTGLPVWVCARRARALRRAVRGGADVVLSDDGLQHAALRRSFEICVVDGRRAFGNRRLLPAGPLRQPLARLDTVDLVLVKRTPNDPGHDLPGTEFWLQPRGLRLVAATGGQVPEPPQAVDAVAGIADPVPFFEQLEASGFIVRRHPLVDHEPLRDEFLAGLVGPIVMTAKDAVRLGPVMRTDIYALDVHARLPQPVLDQVLAHVREFSA